MPKPSQANLLGHAAEIETQAAQSQKAVDAAAKQTQAADSTIAELQQSLQQEQKKTAALMQEAKTAQAETTAAAEPQRRALEEAQAHAAALASELAGTRREIETQAAHSQKAVDAATKQKQAAESTIAELQQSLQQEQKKTTALMQEANAAQGMAADGRALDEAQARAAALASELDGTRREIETQTAQSQKAVDAVTKQQAADSRPRPRDTSRENGCDGAAESRKIARQCGSGQIDRARQCTARSGRYWCCADSARAR